MNHEIILYVLGRVLKIVCRYAAVSAIEQQQQTLQPSESKSSTPPLLRLVRPTTAGPTRGDSSDRRSGAKFVTGLRSITERSKVIL